MNKHGTAKKAAKGDRHSTSAHANHSVATRKCDARKANAWPTSERTKHRSLALLRLVTVCGFEKSEKFRSRRRRSRWSSAEAGPPLVLAMQTDECRSVTHRILQRAQQGRSPPDMTGERYKGHAIHPRTERGRYGGKRKGRLFAPSSTTLLRIFL
jgi:hypothetical protein